MATASLRQQKLERQAFPPLQLTPRLQNSQGQHSTTQATDKQSRRKTLITTGSPSTCMVFTWQRGLTAAILREACGKRGLDCRVLKQWPTLTVPRGHGKKCLPSWKTRFPKLFIEYLGKKKKSILKKIHQSSLWKGMFLSLFVREDGLGLLSGQHSSDWLQWKVIFPTGCH